MTTTSWTAFSLNVLFTGQMFNQVPQSNKSTNGTWGRAAGKFLDTGMHLPKQGTQPEVMS